MPHNGRFHYFFVQQITDLSLDSVRCWWGPIGGAINHLLVCEYFMWRQSAGKVGVCHSVLPFSPSANHLLYSLGEYTSLIIVCNSFLCSETEMGNTSTSTSKSGVYKSGFLLFPHSNRFHPVSFSWILGNCRFWKCRFPGIVVFVKYSTMLVTRTRDGEFYGRNTRPSLFLLAPSPLVRAPFFKINIRFTRPRPCLGKGERGSRPPSFSVGLLAWMFSFFN